MPNDIFDELDALIDRLYDFIAPVILLCAFGWVVFEIIRCILRIKGNG